MTPYSRKKMVRNLKKVCPALYEHVDVTIHVSELVTFLNTNFKNTYKISNGNDFIGGDVPLKALMKHRWIYNLEFIRYNKDLIEFYLL